MTFFQRVATVAAISLTLTGLAGVGTPGIAADVDRSAITVQPVTAPVVINTLNTEVVPQAAPSPAPAVLTATVQPAIQTPAQADENDKFDSLAAAVAAQDQEISDGTLRCLAAAVYYESKSEPMAGQLAVAQVIINRTKSGRFPSDVCGVVKQRGQFSFVRGGALPVIDASRGQYRTALAVAKVALAKAWSSTASNALYFHARHVAPGAGRVVVASIGNHIFFR